MDLSFLSSPDAWLTLVTLSALEIVLGIDNLVFISIAVSRLPEHQRPLARKIGIAVACITRIGLLVMLAFLARMSNDLFHIGGMGISVRDLVLIIGGIFLLWKGTAEIREMISGGEDHDPRTSKASSSFAFVIAQIAVIDIVFSLDSVITAVGMVSNVPVMVAAIVVAVLVMMLASGAISDFIDKHPSLKMLALSFLIVVGTVLIAEAFEVHVPKGYVYFAMAFSLAVEALNIRMRTARGRKPVEPVQLRRDIPGQ